VLCVVCCVLCIVCCVLCVVCGVVCSVGLWCVVSGVLCVVCGVWCVVCGVCVWCVVCGVYCKMWFPNTERISLLISSLIQLCLWRTLIPVIVDPRRCHGPLKCVVCASGHKEPSMLHSAVNGEVLHEGHVDSLCQQCSCPLCPGSNCFVSFRENCVQSSNHNCEFIYWFLFSSVSFASQTYFPDH